MRRAVLFVGTLAVLIGPAILAFFAGGYFDGPRAVAGAVAWALVFGLAVAGPLPWPANRPGRLAVAGLAGLAAWSSASLAWAPLIDPAFDSVERLLLYVAVLLSAVALLRDARAARAVEPVLALGVLAVIGYGLAGRLVPGLVDLIPGRSFGAGGRLEQPITYWNAEGLLAAMGFVLCVRIAGDRSRAAAMRVAAAAACPCLGMGVYLSYSRGAVAAAALGLVVLLAAAPSRPQLRAIGGGLFFGVIAAVWSSRFAGVSSLTGTIADRERDGALMLAILVVVVLGAALLAVLVVRAESAGKTRVDTLRHGRHLPAVAAACAALAVGGLIVGALGESATRQESAAPTAYRFASLHSLRYEYWRVAVDAFLSKPVTGLGAGGFRVTWRKERRVEHSVTEVHSLPLEMVTELGIPGLVCFMLFIGGVAVGAGRALRSGAPLAPAACAVCTAWLLHATIDWDWQLPAVTLPALVLAGGLLAASEVQLPDAAPADWVRDEEPVAVAAR